MTPPFDKTVVNCVAVGSGWTWSDAEEPFEPVPGVGDEDGPSGVDDVSIVLVTDHDAWVADVATSAWPADGAFATVIEPSDPATSVQFDGLYVAPEVNELVAETICPDGLSTNWPLTYAVVALHIGTYRLSRFGVLTVFLSDLRSV